MQPIHDLLQFRLAASVACSNGAASVHFAVGQKSEYSVSITGKQLRQRHKFKKKKEEVESHYYFCSYRFLLLYWPAQRQSVLTGRHEIPEHLVWWKFTHQLSGNRLKKYSNTVLHSSPFSRMTSTIPQPTEFNLLVEKGWLKTTKSFKIIKQTNYGHLFPVPNTCYQELWSSPETFV